MWLVDEITNKAYIPDNRNCFDLRNEHLSPITTLRVGGAEYNPDATSSVSTPALTLSANQAQGTSRCYHGPGFK